LCQSFRVIKGKRRARVIDKGPGMPRRNILLQAIQTRGFATQSNTREEPAEQDVVARLGHRRSAIPTNPYGMTLRRVNSLWPGAVPCPDRSRVSRTVGSDDLLCPFGIVRSIGC